MKNLGLSILENIWYVNQHHEFETSVDKLMLKHTLLTNHIYETNLTNLSIDPDTVRTTLILFSHLQLGIQRLIFTSLFTLIFYFSEFMLHVLSILSCWICLKFIWWMARLCFYFEWELLLLSGKVYRNLDQCFGSVRKGILLCHSLVDQRHVNCTAGAVLAWRIYDWTLWRNVSYTVRL
jgi:hypothetical protein